MRRDSKFDLGRRCYYIQVVKPGSEIIMAVAGLGTRRSRSRSKLCSGQASMLNKQNVEQGTKMLKFPVSRQSTHSSFPLFLSCLTRFAKTAISLVNTTITPRCYRRRSSDPSIARLIPGARRRSNFHASDTILFFPMVPPPPGGARTETGPS